VERPPVVESAEIGDRVSGMGVVSDRMMKIQIIGKTNTGQQNPFVIHRKQFRQVAY
jgi:hypothetical protein